MCRPGYGLDILPFGVARIPGMGRRSFLEDGDTVILKAWCGGRRDMPTIDFGDVSGTIVPARSG